MPITTWPTGSASILPHPRVALRKTLADYLRTKLQPTWPNLTVFENWPTAQTGFPLEAVTVLAAGAAQVVDYHQPVVWKVITVSGVSTVLYSYGRVQIPLQLDAWAQHEAVRDDLAAVLLPLLNQNAEITLGTATLANFANAPGLVLPVPVYADITAEYEFDPLPDAIETVESGMVSEWRYVWKGTAVTYIVSNEIQPVMTQIQTILSINGATETIIE